MADYKGTIAGIGEITYNEDGSVNENSTNVIYPEFDATIRNFIVGDNCILDGLEIDKDTGVLTAGYCQAKGFVGHLQNNITLTYPNGYICAVFKVYKDDHTLDEFYIEEFSDAPSSVPQQDILHGTGTFYLPLYYKGGTNLTRNYPEHSVYSDHANIVSSRLEKGVVGYTHEVTTDDDKVATCKFVYDVIEKEIGDEILDTQIQWGDNTDDYIRLNLHYRAKLVLGTIVVHFGQGTQLVANKTIYTLQEKFRPKEEVLLTGNRGIGIISGTIKTDGTISFTEIASGYNQSGSMSNRAGGYETI